MGRRSRNSAKPPTPSVHVAEAAHLGDILPEGARVRLGTNRLNHVIQRGNTGLCHLAFAPDGRFLLGVGYEDNEASLWELPSGREVWRRGVDCHSEPSAAAAFSPDARLLVIGGCGGVRVFDTATGGEIRVLRTDGCGDMVFTPCGRFLLEGGSVRAVDGWAITAQLEEGTQALTFSADGRFIAGGDDKTVCVREWPSGQLVRRLTGPERRVNAIHFLPNGRIAASGEDETVRVWDIASGRELRSHRWGERRDNIFPAAFRPDGLTLALPYLGRGQATQVIDVETGTVLQQFWSGQGWGNSFCFAWSPDGRTLAVAEDGRCHLWDMQTGIDAAPPGRHFERPDKVLFSEDGRRVLTAGDFRHRDAFVWDVATGELLGTVPPILVENPRTLTLSSDGTHVAAQSVDHPKDLQLYLWEVGAEQPREFPMEAVPVLAWAGGDTLFASVNGTVSVYSPRKTRGTVLSSKSKRLRELRTVADGRVVWRDTEQLVLRDKVGQPRAYASDPITDRVTAISSDGRFVATDSTESIAAFPLFQTNAAAKLDSAGKALPIHSPFIVPEGFGVSSGDGYGHSEVFLADGRLLVAACRGNPWVGGPFVVKAWEAATRLEMWESPTFPCGISEVAFAPGGRSLAVALDDATTLIFDIPVRPLSIDPSWLTATVVTLARSIRADSAFNNLPILADALEDAGCDDNDILVLCRDEKQVHVRGCWVVDLVLGKE